MAEDTKNIIDEWRHIILYAKGWYQKTNTMDDLRRIVSCVTGTEERFISDVCIYENVAEVFNLCIYQSTKDLFLKELFSWLLWYSHTPVYKENSSANVQNAWMRGGKVTIEHEFNFEDKVKPELAVSVKSVIEMMLSKLSCLWVKDGDRVIFDLGNPDKNILPLKDYSKDEIREINDTL